MGLDEQLQNDMKAAMRNKETQRLNTIRLIRATLQAEGTAKRQRQLDDLVKSTGKSIEDMEQIPAAEPLTDDEMLKVIAREVKKRQDSVDAYTKAGRDELAAEEQAEIEILKTYLPATLSIEEVRPLVQAIIDEVGATSKADLKKVMPVVMGRLRDKADGRTLNQVVGELLK